MMRFGILGTGMVGYTLGTALVRKGHQVMMGSRSASNEKARSWVASAGSRASQGTFDQAARFGDIVFNCTAGNVSLEALATVGQDAVHGKILIDVANPLDFSKGMPPTLTICNTDSLGERIQAAFPTAHVVKTLNTINSGVMVDPSAVAADHNLFVCGNDVAAKARVTDGLAEWFGWKLDNIIDLGDITASRATEMWVILWIRLSAKFQNPNVGLQVVVGPKPAARH